MQDVYDPVSELSVRFLERIKHLKSSRGSLVLNLPLMKPSNIQTSPPVTYYCPLHDHIPIAHVGKTTTINIIIHVYYLGV